VARIVIDPVTRIGGQLRIEVEVANGVVSDAWSSGTMFRGLELILKGRDPRDAWLFAQRVCGAATGVHALASVRAVENALGVTVPRNARLVRNVIAGAEFVRDHVVHFYHMHALDWADVLSATTADPAATSTLARSISDWPNSSAADFLGARDRLATFVKSGQTGPFANGYWGHPAFRLSPEANLMIVAHYLEALDWHRTFSRIHTLLGGKNPHPQTFLVGGMALTPPWGGPSQALPGEHPSLVERNAPTALSPRGLADIADLISSATAFVDQVYVPDVLAIARQYGEWAGIGTGIGNYLSFGEFPEDDSSQPALLLPRGRIMDRSLTTLDTVDQAGIAETVAHSHYTYDGGDGVSRHPWEGQTAPRYEGPKPPVTTLAGSAKYSWLKAPRYVDEPMEVGPLARMLVGYVGQVGAVRDVFASAAAGLGGGPELVSGTLGRTVARALEAQVIAKRLAGWRDDLVANIASGDLALADITHWNPETWPRQVQGYALGETSQGALGHWLKIRDARIDAYQLIDASTWNASPRDDRDHRGALEQALVGTPVEDASRPLEILRTVHSFDPCTACAVHAYDPQGRGPIEIRIVPGGVG